MEFQEYVVDFLVGLWLEVGQTVGMPLYFRLKLGITPASSTIKNGPISKIVMP